MDASRYQLVDSLYGPGTVAAWLLSLCAVLMSWTLNKSSREKDSISLDFIAALLLPLIAAGHIVLQIVRMPVSVAEAITTEDVDLQRYAAALEAPLSICETFSIASLLLAICCGPWWRGHVKWKRIGLVFTIGLLSWGAENVMFVVATMKGIHVVDTTLSRPYLFFITPIVATTWGFLALTVAVGAVVWIVGRTNARRGQKVGRHSKRERRNDTVRPKTSRDLEVPNRVSLEWLKMMDAEMERSLGETRLLSNESQSMMMMTSVTMVFLPLSFVASAFGLSFSETKDSSVADRKQFFLIPRSDASMNDLDQIVALVGGILALLAALWHAYHSRRDEKQAPERLIQRRRSF